MAPPTETEPPTSSTNLYTLAQILTRVENDVKDLKIGVRDLVDQKGKLSGGFTVIKWVFGLLFGVVFSTMFGVGSYFFLTVNGHSERLTVLEVQGRNEQMRVDTDIDSKVGILATKMESEFKRVDQNHADNAGKINALVQTTSGVPQLGDEVSNLIKAVSDRTSDNDHMKNQIATLQDDLGSLTHTVRGLDDDLTLFKERLSTPPARK